MLSDSDENPELIDRLNVLHAGYLYGKGKAINISSHEPPHPFGDRDIIPPFDKNPHILDRAFINSRSFSDHVFTKLSMERQENCQMQPVPEDKAVLVIEEVLAMQDGIGPQVVLCKFGKREGRIRKPTVYWDTLGLDRRPTQVVAKIYDPLLYPKIHFLFRKNRVDVVNAADREYAREAAAHADLHEASKTQPILRDFVPRFYGTWTTTIKNEEGSWGRSETRPDDDGANGILRERTVRIILMEYINGKSIQGSCRRGYEDHFPVLKPDEKKGHDLDFRLNVLARILRGLMALQHIGIIPREVWPHRFKITDDVDPDKRLQVLGKARVVMLNYGFLQHTRYLSEGPHEDQSLPRPRHPARSGYNPDHLQLLAGWFPRKWIDDEQPFIDWVQKVFREEDFAEVKPLPDITQPGSSKEAEPSSESTKQVSGSDKIPSKVPKIRLVLKNTRSSSASESIAGSDH